MPDGRVDHLWIRVRDPQASRRFYTTIAPHAGLAHDDPGRVQLAGPDYSFSLVRDGGRSTSTFTSRSPRATTPVRRPTRPRLAAG